LKKALAYYNAVILAANSEIVRMYVGKIVLATKTNKSNPVQFIFCHLLNVPILSKLFSKFFPLYLIWGLQIWSVVGNDPKGWKKFAKCKSQFLVSKWRPRKEKIPDTKSFFSGANHVQCIRSNRIHMYECRHYPSNFLWTRVCRVSRWVCEKIAKNVARPIFCQN
jgi:hypothetical protein